MSVEEIHQLLTGLKLELIWSFLLAATAFYIFVWIKDFLTTMMQYYQFKSNSYVSIGNMVSVNDFVGRIKNFGRTYIVIEGEAGYYRISMQNWQKHKWIFLRTEWKKESEIAGRRLGLRHDDDIKIDRDLFNKVTSVIKYFEERGELKIE